MAVDAHANFAVSLVATAPSPATSGTSLIVTAGQGSRFPAAPFNAVIGPANTLLTPANSEIVRVTGISTDTLTITRTQEGSSARTVVIGDQVFCGPTAKTFTDIEATDGGFPYRPDDHGYLAWTFWPGYIQSTAPLSSGLAVLNRINTRGPARAISNLYFYLSAVGSVVTAAGAWVYVWDNTGTLLATSATQATAWTTAGNITPTLLSPLPVAMSFNTPANSWIWVGVHVPSATTYPSFGRGLVPTNAITPNLGLTGSQFIASQLSGQAAKITTSLSLPLAANTFSGSPLWIAMA